MAAGLAEFDPETRYAKDVLIGPHNPDLGKTLAVEWSRQAVRIEAEGEVAFISRFAAELSRLCLGHPELGSQAALAAVLDLHRRQAWSVAQALKDAIASNLDGIALHRIPPTSLLMMHIGDQPTMQSDLAEPPSAGLPATQARRDWEESDQIVSPDGPWTVIFRVEAGRPSVDIVGLDTISGPPAQIAHLLKVVFQQDLERGLPFSEHQYVLIYQLPGVAIGKTLAAQHVSRFRKSAAVAYERLFHHPPAEPLLIESSGRKGHRLDPRTRVIDRN